MTPDTRKNAYLALALVCLVWGTTYLGIRIALETIPPFLMAAIRWTVAGTLMILIFRWRGIPLPHRREWGSLLVLSILMIGFGNGAVVWAQQTVPSGLASVLVAAAPFYMVGVEQLAPDGERITATTLAGLVIGFAGIVLLVWPEVRLSDGGGFLGGVFSIQLAILGWSIGSSYSKRRAPQENVLTAAALQMVFAGLCLFVLATPLGEWQALSFNARTVVALAYLILVGSLLGFTAYTYALKHLPVATVSLYAYVNPVIAVALGTLVLGEPLNPRIAAASALVLVGTTLAKRS